MDEQNQNAQHQRAFPLPPERLPKSPVAGKQETIDAAALLYSAITPC
jgi:hypothetical protein